MRILGVIIILSYCLSVSGQTSTYTNENNETHLWGHIQFSDLDKKPYKKWFTKNYDDYLVSSSDASWVEGLQEVNVRIILGTWCGDSKRWVPKFVKMWDSLGLDRSQLEMVAISNTEEDYKQGPNGEEIGLGIHRVPTFIFEKDSKEIGRIVEQPTTSLETDLAQIALGYPSSPNYKCATYMINLLKTKSLEEIEKDFRKYLNEAFKVSGKRSELNTLGYVYLRSGLVEKALVVFKFNTRFFENDPRVYDSYAEALLVANDKNGALENYQKVLELDPENKHAQEQVSKLQPQIKN